MIDRIAEALLAELDRALEGGLTTGSAERSAAVKDALTKGLVETYRECASGMRERAFRAARGVAYERTKAGAEGEAKGAEAAAEAIRALDVEPPEEAP